MHLRLFLIGLVYWFSDSAKAQLPADFFLLIKDNVSLNQVWNDYLITSDSLIITGDSDFGRSRVKYLSRSLTKKEKKELNSFFRKYDYGSLEDIYQNEPNHEQLTDEVHTYRILKAEGRYNQKEFKSSMHNCYAGKIVELAELVNRFVPQEVKIRIRKDDFAVIIP